MNYEELAGILRLYDVPVGLGAVKAAFEAEQASPGLADWARLHLTPDSLLTVDDLLQYSTLEKSGKVDQLAASADLVTVQSFSDQELKDAIEELNRSTATIAQQTDTLKQQQDALTRLVKGKTNEAERRSALELKHAQAWELGRKTSTSDVEALAQDIDMCISELEQQGSAQSDALQQTVNTMFISDDKLFASLQKLGWELEMGDPEEKEMEAKLREICARLIKYTVETIRTRLDRLYLESIEASGGTAATNGRGHGDDVPALQEELESLYAEILPVAQMSVEEQFLGPALKSLSARNGKSLVRSAHAANYIHDCLDYLLDRIGRIASRIETFQAHRTASLQLVVTARAELSVQVEPAHKKERRPTVGASPLRRRKSSTQMSGMSPGRGRAPSTSRRRSSSTGAHSDKPPLEQLLQHLALIIPGATTTADVSTLPRQQTAALAATLADRTSKATDVARNVQESFEDAAAEQLKDAGLALQMLRDSLLAESPFGQVRLVDPEIEDSIGVLDQELEKVRSRLEGVDVEIVKARGRKGKRDEIIRRWGR